jgi:hypothetical protein
MFVSTTAKTNRIDLVLITVPDMAQRLLNHLEFVYFAEKIIRTGG